MNFELFKIPQGKMLIAFSDKNLSVGALWLDPKKELPKHNRPVLESLFQLKGKSLIKIFEKAGIKEVILKEDESIDIPPLKYHIHSNPYDEISITLWKFIGDVTEVINKIRESGKR